MRDPLRQTVWDFIRQSWLVITVFTGIASVIGLITFSQRWLPPPLPSQNSTGVITQFGNRGSKYRPINPYAIVRLKNGWEREIGISLNELRSCQVGDKTPLIVTGVTVQRGAGPLCPERKGISE